MIAPHIRDPLIRRRIDEIEKEFRRVLDNPNTPASAVMPLIEFKGNIEGARTIAAQTAVLDKHDARILAFNRDVDAFFKNADTGK